MSHTNSKISIKKIIGQIHLWLGLLSGLVVFILGITGCIYAFQSELKELFYADRYFVKSKGIKPLPIRKLKESAQKTLGDEYPITFLHYIPETSYAYRFRASKTEKEALTYNSKVLYNKMAFVDQYTAEVLFVEDTKWEFFNVVLQIHYDLLLNKIGHQIVGWSTLIFVVMLISGLVLWWPKNKAAIKQRLYFKWKVTTKWKRKNYDLHNIPGFYSLTLALIISLTGLWFAFEWFRPPVKWIANGGKPVIEEKKVFSDTTHAASPDLIDIIEKNIRERNIKGAFFYMTFPEGKKTPVVVTAMHNKDNFVKRSQYFFDKNTGEELKCSPYESKSSADKFGFMIYDIHVGKIIGLPGQILAFFAALIAASLPLTGVLIWIGKKGRKTNSKPAKKTKRTVDLV
ncbi:PepSY-associated TM helix domain-containing protein [Sporocytophaga myxococcoides]|uniref:PepSY-associated TM helix domain-containing protein n=1 Tax=Sporocytophaga myxococcoides TaxID=153721 RepID=UPI0018CF0C7C|nr:PepSY-associated TM helix domain-containing protein [Sporocytophaga myxococcoides]